MVRKKKKLFKVLLILALVLTSSTSGLAQYLIHYFCLWPDSFKRIRNLWHMMSQKVVGYWDVSKKLKVVCHIPSYSQSYDASYWL